MEERKKLVAVSKGVVAPSGKHSTTETGFKICNWRIIILCGRDCLYLHALYDAKYILSPRNNMNYFYLFIYGTSGDNNVGNLHCWKEHLTFLDMPCNSCVLTHQIN